VQPGLPLADLAHSPAVMLFVERALDVSPAFALTPENAPAVAAICQRLDGLPLAIELAAARIRVLPPAALLARLASPTPTTSLHLLTGGARDLPARHQTLRNAIAWSYDLLDSPEQMLFRRLAVFVGGCTLAAAEHVTGDEGAFVFAGLDSLVSKSLLRHEPGAGEEPRFQMLETIREYALEQLGASGEVGGLQQAHAGYYLTLAEIAEPALEGAEQGVWLDRLEQEHDNLRAALHWALGQADPAPALRLSGALWHFWYVHGYWSEGLHWLEETLAGRFGLPLAVQAKALKGAGVLATELGDYDRARAYFEENLAQRRALADRPGIADALNNLGLLAHNQGDYAPAQQFFAESLALRRDLGDPYPIAVTLNNLGLVAADQGDYGQAVGFYEESLALARQLDDAQGIAIALSNLGEVALAQGHYDQARQLHTESLSLCWDLGDKQGIALCLEGLAGVAGAQGAAERAAQLLGASEALRTTIGAQLQQSNRSAYDQLVAAAQAQLDATTWAAAWAAGASRPLAQVVAEATQPRLDPG
ncbi:MAG TPA: tetratricopeptide repeat protein, partial [Chloroflexia bacterium]|nr:tetratricopeptide repeat protein [Chloroflexia bacterium]